MRRALVISPIDPDSSLVSARVEAIAWLREVLGRAGFQVVVVSDTENARRRIDDAIARMSPEDAVLVHVTGDVRPDGALHLDAENALPLREVSDAIAARGLSALAFFAELAHDGSLDDSLGASEHVESVRDALDAKTHGAWALVAMHARAESADPIAFSRLMIATAEEATANGPAFLSDVYDRVRAMPESHAAAQSYALVRGAEEFELAGVTAPDLPSQGALPDLSDDADEDDSEAHATSGTIDVAPDLTALVALADGAYARDALDQAMAGYRAALVLLAPGDLATRASVLARVGQIDRSRGNVDEATRAFERSHSIAPRERAALDGLIDLATATGEWTRAVALRRKRLEIIDDVVERVDELFALARTLVEKLRDVEGAVQELSHARALDPARHDVLEALRRSNRVLQRWPEMLEVTDALVASATTPRARATLRLSQARIAIERLEDDDRAVTYLEAALAEDGELEEARVLLAAIRGEPSTAEVEYARRSSSAIVTRGPTELDSRVVRADALAAQGEDLAAIAELETLAVQAPWDDAAYTRLHTLHSRGRRDDRAYLAALALEELGALDDVSQATLDLFRPDRALRARGSLDEAAWRSIRAPGADDVVEAIFTAIGRAAVAASLEDRKARKQLVSLDPARKQSETSTASIVRCFHWAAQVLDVASPEVYVLDAVPGEIAAVPASPPAIAIGPGVLSGLSMKHLAFLTGRHVTYYRTEHQVLVHYPTLNELTVLLLAAVQLVSPGLPVQQSYAEDVAALRERLARHISEGERIATAAAARKLEARGHRVNLAAWIRGVELTAGRAGLLLAGDLKSAMDRVRGESRAIAGVSADDRRADLLSFCASSVHADLRDRFAVTAGSPPERAPVAPDLRAAG